MTRGARIALLLLCVLSAPGAWAQEPGESQRKNIVRIEEMQLELDFRESKERWAPQTVSLLADQRSALVLHRIEPESPALLAIITHAPASTEPRATGGATACEEIVAALGSELALETQTVALRGRHYELAIGSQALGACKANPDGSHVSLLVRAPEDQPLQVNEAADIVEAFLDYSGVGKAAPHPFITEGNARDEEMQQRPRRLAEEISHFSHLTYLHASDRPSDDFRGFGMARTSMLLIGRGGPIAKTAALDLGSGSTGSGGFAYELAVAPRGYALRLVPGLILGSYLSLGFDGVTGGRLHLSAFVSGSVFLKVGSKNYFLLARATNLWLHRNSREEGSSHAILAGDELRAEIGIGARVHRNYQIGLALRAQEMLGTRFVGGSLGLYFR